VSDQRDVQGPWQDDTRQLDESLSVLALAVASGGLVDPRVVVEQHPELTEPAAMERLRWFLLLTIAQGKSDRTQVYLEAWRLLAAVRALLTGEGVPVPAELGPQAQAARPAVTAFVNSTSWSDGKRIVRQAPELLEDGADQLLDALVDAFRRYGSTQEATAIEQRQTLLRRARDVGVDAAFGQPPDRGVDGQALSEAIMAFLRADSLYELALVLEQRPELLEDGADELLGEELAEQRRPGGDAALADVLEGRRRLLRRAREAGVRAATDEFAERELGGWPGGAGTAALPEEWRLLLLRGIHAEDRYEATGALDALDEAVEAAEAALALPEVAGLVPVLRLETHKQAARARIARYRATGGRDDLDRAIELDERADAEAPTDTLRVQPLNDLGVGLQLRHLATGDTADLDRAIELHERAIPVTSSGAAERHELLDNLGVGLRLRYDRSGDLRDLDRAIEAHGEAATRAAGGARLLHLYLANLSTALRRRFERTGDARDLDGAVAAAEQAIARAEQGSGRADAQARPDVRQRGLRIPLGAALELRFRSRGDPGDLDRAIEVLTEEAAALEEGAADLPAVEGNLAVCLTDRYRRDRQAGDLDRAVELHERVAAALPSGSPARIVHLNGLGWTLQQRHAAGGDSGDLEGAVSAYRLATSQGLETDALAGLSAARRWASWATEREAWAEAAEAGRIGLRAADRLLRAQLFREHKEAWLGEAVGLPELAAYAFAMTGAPEDALLALEQGRAVLLSEALDRGQADLRRLADAGHGELAGRYRRAGTSIAALEYEEVGGGRTLAPAERVKALRAARAELAAVTGRIRQLPGHERFLEPAGVADVRAAAGDAQLAYVAATPAGGLALVVGAGREVTPVWLPQLTDEALRQVVVEQRVAYAARRQEPAGWQAALDRTTGWLWTAVMGPLLDALAPAGRAVLVPTGLLGLLPLHAAWCEDPARPSGRRYALDELLLTYAPNARALQAADAARAAHAEVDGILAVEDPRPSDTGPLPHAAGEVRAALAGFAHGCHLPGGRATRAAVVDALGAWPVLHFACHGLADPDRPLDSCLLLGGGERLTLRDLLGRDGPLGARLAVLSACETALVGLELVDEVIGLPAGLLQAGTAGVVGSLWSVPDDSTKLLMVCFYRLWRGQGVEPAEALRQAQQWVRDTTNGAKRAALPDEPALAGPAGSAAARSLWEGTLGLAHPANWAAFAFTGA
jgi:CHAT domain-containing protein